MKDQPDPPNGRETVRTVLGPIDPGELGATLMHEHAPLLDWSELHRTPPAPLDPAREMLLTHTVDLLDRFHDSLPDDMRPGALVEATPIRVGRYPQLLQDLAERSKVHVIAATGFWGEALAPLHPWVLEFADLDDGVERMAELFIHEIEEGMEDPAAGWGEVFTDIRAGIIKIGTSARIQPGERLIHRAAAMASRQTGCPITTHTNFGGGLAEARLLIDEGAAPDKVIIGHQGHLDDSEHPESDEYHEKITELGCWVQFDRVGYEDYEVAKQARQIVHLIDRGHVDRLLLSHDRAPFWMTDYEGQNETTDLWDELDADFTTVTTSMVATLRESGVTAEDIRSMLVENPRKVLSF